MVSPGSWSLIREGACRKQHTELSLDSASPGPLSVYNRPSGPFPSPAYWLVALHILASSLVSRQWRNVVLVLHPSTIAGILTIVL